jgi:hypothetical protein
MKNLKEIVVGAAVLGTLWAISNWFKLLVVVVLVFMAFNLYSYSQANAEQNCLQYGAGLDKDLTQQLNAMNAEDTSEGSVIPSSLRLSMQKTLGETSYQYKGGVCYRDFDVSTIYTSIATTTQMTSDNIENAYTHESYGSCNIEVINNQTLPIDSDCDTYYKEFDKIFYNMYGT